MKLAARTFLAIVLTGVASVFVGAESSEKKSPPTKDERSDRAKLQGLWQVTTKGKTFVIPIGELRFGTKLIYTLRPEKKPKEIDFRHGGANDHPRVTTKGIYVLEKDTLKVCWVYNRSRPTEFKSKPKEGQRMLTLTRIKNPERQ